MRTAQDHEKMFGVDAERIAEIDEDARKGALQGVAGDTVTGPGRPPLFDEPMQQVSFKEPGARVRAIDRRAEQLGVRRSDYLRQLVENDLQCAGMI